jgi:arylsulfatase
VRETIFANQKRLGIMPANAELTPWPKDLPQWDSLSVEEKTLFIRQADVFGAYLAYTDHEIGRVIQAVEDMGQLDNTLIIYIAGDNGASSEGMLNGTPNEFTTFNGVPVPVKDQFLWYPFWGSERNLPALRGSLVVGDGHAVQVDEAGGVALRRNGAGRGVSWPATSTSRRDPPPVQPPHRHRADDPRSDGIPLPDTVDGIKQRPMDGVSMAYTWNKANANAPTRTRRNTSRCWEPRHLPRRWIAATTPQRFRGNSHQAGARRHQRVQLGTLQRRDAVGSHREQRPGAKMPEKLKQMQELFYAEAKKFDVLPLDNTSLLRWNTPRLTSRWTQVFTYSGELISTPNSGAPSILNKSYTITAEVTIPEGGAEGMIVTDGGRFGGYGLFLSKGELASAGASRCSFTTCSTSSARRGKGPS